MDPIGSLIGSVLLGAGVVLLYGAYRNKRVFGADGIIPSAIASGSITDLEDTPTAVGGFGTGIAIAGGEGKATGKASKLDHAFNTIANSDATLAADIESRTYAVSSATTRVELIPLRQLLLLADAKGFRDSANIIREYIWEVTNERI